MSTDRQFLVPLNYDITKQVYPTEEFVRKRQYPNDEVKSTKQYHKIYTNTFIDESNFYADKLRRRAKFR
jgi:hypothetical protein